MQCNSSSVIGRARESDHAGRTPGREHVIRLVPGFVPDETALLLIERCRRQLAMPLPVLAFRLSIVRRHREVAAVKRTGQLLPD